MIRAIHHTAISTQDLERSRAFYRDLLGFREVSTFAWKRGAESADRVTGLVGSAAKVALLRLDNAFIELFEFESPQANPLDPDRPVCDHGITHLCIEVTEIDEEYERLSQAGMRFHTDPVDMGSGARATYGRDPDGNVIELLQIPEGNAIALEE
ncbi:MAG: VOC family protein [Actinomycetia bacterium]|nr:VOC family protein [Actinomycetes bacterium]MCP4222485.1 VOC family protein [Actinomycetes bacterium]MCP5030531.1 VOC family protein [Actinomycetes bacterium]